MNRIKGLIAKKKSDQINELNSIKKRISALPAEKQIELLEFISIGVSREVNQQEKQQKPVEKVYERKYTTLKKVNVEK